MVYKGVNYIFISDLSPTHLNMFPLATAQTNTLVRQLPPMYSS